VFIYIKIKIYRTIIFPVVLYGYETQSFMLWKECTLRVQVNLFPTYCKNKFTCICLLHGRYTVLNALRALENRVLRKIFWLKIEGVNGDWRKLYNKELHDFCTSPNIMWIIKSRLML
jgi:hypothetical protein